MSLSTEQREKLYNWVVQALSFYAADKEKLATYVTALVEASGPERPSASVLTEELRDFLGDNTRSFVRRLVDHVNQLLFSGIVFSGHEEHRSRDHDDRHRSHRRSRSRSRSRSPPSKRSRESREPPARDAPRRSDFAPPRGGTSNVVNTSTPATVVVGTKSATLNVTNIPPAVCDMARLSGFFSRFGPLEQVRVDAEHQRASVTFVDALHARAALRSPQPVFNNRFIKIFWDNSNLISLDDLKDVPVPPHPPSGFGRGRGSHLHHTDPNAPAPVRVVSGDVPPPQAPKITETLSVEELEKRRAEYDKNIAQLEEVRHQKEDLRKKQLSQINEMTQMAAKATGKKKKFLLEQIRDLTSAVEMSLIQERGGAPLNSQLSETVRALEEKAGQMGIKVPNPKHFERRVTKKSRTLDNRPRTLNLTNLPDSVPLPVVMSRFKNFGLIDEIDLESDPKFITFATHEAAVVAQEKGKELKNGEDTHLLEMELVATKPKVVPSAEQPLVIGAPAVAVRQQIVLDADGAEDDGAEEQEEDDQDVGEKNWKR